MAAGFKYTGKSKQKRKIIKACEEGDRSKLLIWERKGWNPFGGDLKSIFGLSIASPNESNNPLFGVGIIDSEIE